MHDLKMTDNVAQNNGVWKMTDIIEFPVTHSSLDPKIIRSNYDCICNVCLTQHCQATMVNYYE